LHDLKFKKYELKNISFEQFDLINLRRLLKLVVIKKSNSLMSFAKETR